MAMTMAMPRIIIVLTQPYFPETLSAHPMQSLLRLCGCGKRYKCLVEIGAAFNIGPINIYLPSTVSIRGKGEGANARWNGSEQSMRKPPPTKKMPL
jgi:hypothetical protein